MDIYYELHKSENENAENLVLVPGSAEGIHRFEPYLEMLSEKFNVLLFDNPGVGKTPLCKFTAETLAAEYHRISASVGFKEFHLLGHSFGGFIVQHMADIKPEPIKSLVIVSIGPGGAKKQADIIRFQLGSDEDRFQKLFGKPFRTKRSDFVDQFIAEAGKNSVDVRVAYVIGSIMCTTWQICPKIQNRTLVVHGNTDPIVDFSNGELLAKLIPNSRLLELNEVGHFPYIEDDSCWQKIIDFCLNSANIGTVLDKDIVLTEKMIEHDEVFKKVSNAEDFPEFMMKVFGVNKEQGVDAAVDTYYNKVVNG